MSSSATVARTARRRREPLSTPKLPRVSLSLESQGELREPEQVVADVETRLCTNSKAIGCKQTRANQLHHEADQLCYKGDYESALVLYHRASQICPREQNHQIAAWRIQAAIDSEANTSKDFRVQSRSTLRPPQMSGFVCPEVAAHRARDVVAESSDPLRDIPRILRFFESRKDFWRLPSPSNSSITARSKMMLKKMNKCVSSTFMELETAYESGDTATVHKLGDVLVDLASVSEEPNRNQLELYGYLASKQISLGRHDRAVCLAVKMIFLARSCGNVHWITEALVVIGKVHLAFGHLDALARVWERLVDDLKTEAIPQAWLYHDIGRCHFELENFGKALDVAKLCLKSANAAQSKKWTVRGQLLTGQSLLKLGRFGEAVIALKMAAMVALEEDYKDEQWIIRYIQSLIDQVAGLLRQINQKRKDESESCKSCDDATETKAPMTNLIVNKINDDASSETEEDKEARVPGAAQLAKEEPSTPKQRKRHYRTRPRPDNQDDTSDEETVSQLLEKIGSLRRTQTSNAPMMLADKVLDIDTGAARSLGSSEADIEDLNIDSSRTHIIRSHDSKINSEDEMTLKAHELVSLSDFSCIDDTGEEDLIGSNLDDIYMSDVEAIQSEVDSIDMRSTAHTTIFEEANDKSATYFSPYDELTFPSFSCSLDSESLISLASDNQCENTLGMSSYLKGLKSHDFEELCEMEKHFVEDRFMD
ncbi:PREDICTED: tetratricopeptide repeat protein 25-like [Ceratosolen solmsi marchali]|uniref:Tetratricopeptide repeat protein 25-like n=1 Tax=Ceratosolen solmsi marchali TaxID=326594 RepID=A0AAJ7DWF8_9HYME|nr:PREDICTED: tetratricopeptide repeat protein 25-like [Ceratosolen solmsi marchali]